MNIFQNIQETAMAREIRKPLINISGNNPLIPLLADKSENARNDAARRLVSLIDDFNEAYRRDHPPQQITRAVAFTPTPPRIAAEKAIVDAVTDGRVTDPSVREWAQSKLKL